MKKKKICFITGTRADYGILFPVMKKVKSSPKLELHIIVTGMHLEKEYGETVKEIKNDGFQIYASIRIKSISDEGKKMAYAIGEAILKFTDIFSKLRPDIVVVMGDRGEMLAAAIAANYLNIPVAHIHGGELSGHVDNTVRHAITKLAHLHFTATKKAKERILKMGEEPWRVIFSGAPALDRILHENLPNAEELRRKYRLKDQRIILVVQHPVLTEASFAAKQMEETLKAVMSYKLPTVIIYPNSDTGSRGMIKVIEKYKKTPFIQIFKSLPHRDYLGLLKIASVLVGNSSSGIIEAATFGLPVVNIGSRQVDREKPSNVLDVGYDKRAIINALKKVFENKKYHFNNPYGDGQASFRIVRVLESNIFNRKILAKQMTY